MTTSDLVDYLNDLWETDSAAIHTLCINRVPANQGLVQHPTALCNPLSDGKPTIGLIGIINGFLSSQNMPLICMYWDDVDGKHVFRGFKKYEESDGE